MYIYKNVPQLWLRILHISRCSRFLFCSDWSRVLVNHAGKIVHSHTNFHVQTNTNTAVKLKIKMACHLSPQAVNFALIPPVARTTFLGGIALTFTIYLYHLRQQPGHKFE